MYQRQAGVGNDGSDDWSALDDDADAVRVAANIDGETYYEILGVSPTATNGEIKRAYYNSMKECHPDLSANSEAATEFCKLLNDIYETLVDEDSRRIYDELHGLTLSAANPFLSRDDAYDRVFVDEATCIGCRNCVNTAPASFALEDEYGRARIHTQGADSTAKLDEAIETCPVNCIHWVTRQQLSLLEDEMSRIERVGVGFMMAGQGAGKGRDVFGAASDRWEKRKMAATQRLEEEMVKQHGPFWKWTRDKAESGAAANGAGDNGGYNGTASASAKTQDVANRRATQARQWRDFQRARRNSKPILLAASSSPGDRPHLD